MANFETKKSYPGVRRRVGSKEWSWRLQLNGKTYEDYGYKTAKEAFEARERTRADLKSKGFSNVNCKKTFNDVYNEFIEDKAKYRAYSTLKRYRSIYTHHIEPFFGDKLIKNITTADLEKFFIKYNVPQKDKKYGTLRKYSHEFIDGFRKLLNNVFDQAIKQRYIFLNPLSSVSKDMYRTVGEPKEEGRFLKPNEISKIAERFKSKNLYMAFMLAYHLGLRIGEVFGLLWSDVNFNARTITLNRQLIAVSNKHIYGENVKGTTWCFAPLKTPAAYRVIDMTPDLYMYLLFAFEAWNTNKSTFGARYQSTYKVGRMNDDEEKTVTFLDNVELPFMNVKPDGSLLTPGSATYMFKVIQKELGINASFHDLRHTHLTMLAEIGYPPVELQLRAGHEKIETTISTYYHNTDNSKALALKCLQGISIRNIDEVVAEEQMSEDIAIELSIAGELPTENNNFASAELLGGDYTPSGFKNVKTLKKKSS